MKKDRNVYYYALAEETEFCIIDLEPETLRYTPCTIYSASLNLNSYSDPNEFCHRHILLVRAQRHLEPQPSSFPSPDPPLQCNLNKKKSEMSHHPFPFPFVTV
ncbi:hypothetical protein YC2023_058982 [Brassica napus]